MNKKTIILLGSVAGGSQVMAYTAALDSRVAAVAPFNFGRVTPMGSPMGDEFGDWESVQSPRWSISGQFLPWFVCASVAPRYFIFSQEVQWPERDIKPAWARFEKVWGFYNATDHIGEAHGFGTFPGPGEAWSIGPGQRRELEPILDRWFGIPIPWQDQERTKYVNLEKRPVENRRPASDLMGLTPALASQIPMKTVAEITTAQGKQQVDAARQKLAGMSASERQDWLRQEWKKHLGGSIDPNPHPAATVEWTKNLRFGHAEAISLTTDPSVVVPMLLLLPSSSVQKSAPVVVAVSEGGKDLFLDKRNSQIEALLKSGHAICLPDVRGTGETTADSRRDPDGAEVLLGAAAYMMDDSLLGQRLKDLRTVLVYLRSRHEIDSHRIGLWGDSFEPANPAHMLMDELPQWQIGPDIEQRVEPLGGMLAMLGALYEPDVKTISVRGGLTSFLSMLQDGFPYVPQDVVVPGVLSIGDMGALTAALAPRPIELAGMVNGKDQLVSIDQVRAGIAPPNGQAPASITIHSGQESPDVFAWFEKHL